MATWHAQATGGYAESSVEARDNAEMTYGILHSLGWSLNAICGYLGNVGSESAYNPWRWEADKILGPDGYDGDTAHGYGLVQWTPGGNYIQNATAQAQLGYNPNYSGHPGNVSDARAQLYFMHVWSADNQWDSRYTGYPLTWAQFIKSDQTPEYLASAFLYNFERPDEQQAAITEPDRRAAARRWYDYLGGITPPTPGTSSGLPLWMLLFPF